MDAMHVLFVHLQLDILQSITVRRLYQNLPVGAQKKDQLSESFEWLYALRNQKKVRATSKSKARTCKAGGKMCSYRNTSMDTK